MSESKFWRELNAGFKNRWDAERVDNKLAPAFPDVSYGMEQVNGFIELKVLECWPRTDIFDLRQKFGAQFPAQRRWLIRRGAEAGHCFLFLWVKRPSEWLIFDHLGMNGWPHNLILSKSALARTACGHWTDWIHWERLALILTKDPICYIGGNTTIAQPDGAGRVFVG